MAALVALILVALLVLPAGCSRSRPSSAQPAPLAPSAPTGRLQEVAPPTPVQQLQTALAERDPRVTIERPADGTTLPPGTWTLRLRVRDWPLVDAGALGLGSHLAVQIDDQPVLRLTEHRSTSAGAVVETELPALAAGSHRITAYAARPWGEAVKSPGAATRITVQSVVGNPLVLPAPGSPELVAVSPAELSSAEPLLLDWLLFDAPLQNLRDGDGSWRLRVSVNGDAFLLDQNVPLWLTGWNNGSNALQLELVDGQGAPLNAPFNSLVQEVTLTGGDQPRWLGGPLTSDELAVLLGEAPAPMEQPDQNPPIPEPWQEPAAPSGQELAPDPGKELAREVEQEDGAISGGPSPAAPLPEPDLDPDLDGAAATLPSTAPDGSVQEPEDS